MTKLLDIPVKDVKTLALSPDSSLLVAGTWEGKSVVLDVGSGKVISRLGSHGGPVDVLAISPDNRILAASSGKTIEVWSVATSHRLASIPETQSAITALHFTPDSGRLLVDFGAEVEVWTAAMDKRLSLTRKGTASGAFDPSGRVTVLTTETEVHLWDLVSNRVVETIPIGGSGDAAKPDTSQIAAVAFSPDGARIAIGLVSGCIVVKEIGGRR